MNEKYYKSTKTGALLRASRIENVYFDIFGPLNPYNNFTWCDKLIKDGTLVEIKDPTVIDFLKQNDRIGAVVRYRELHNDCPLGVAYSMVNKIAEDLKAFEKK